MIDRRTLLGGTALLATAARVRAANGAIRIGVLNDMSGVYADYQGRGSVLAAELAAADAGRVLGMPVEIVSADHQNKPDVGAAQARRWLDLDGVDAIIDVPNSAVAFAVSDLCREKNRVLIASGAGSSELTGARCSPNTVHWTYDTWSLGNSLGQAIVGRGGKRWFLIVADYAFGHDLQRQVTEAVQRQGGSVAGAVRCPLGTTDYSSFLVQAQASRADVLCLANAGDDTVTALKQAVEFGLTRNMQVCGPIVNINVVAPVGLRDAQGIFAVMPFYWDMNDATRAFARRFQDAHPRKLMPNDMQAGCYAGVVHYLKAVAQVGGTAGGAADGRAVVGAMKAMPTNDPLFGQGSIRADGRKVHPVYLMQAKAPAESKGMWDFFKPVSTVPAEQAYRPLADGRCTLVTG